MLYKTLNIYTNYKASSNGDIIRIGGKYSKDKPLKPSINSFGYYRVSLYNDGIKKSYSVHRLIAETFLDNLGNKPTVNHKNGIKTDNRVENLEWATNSEQNIHYFRVLGGLPNKTGTGKFGKLHHNSKKVICVDTGEKFNAIAEASRELRIDTASIIRVCQNKLQTAGGLKLKYL